MRRFQKRGFTVVELAVVAATVSLLLVVLLPAVNGARIVARQSSCRENLKLIGLGLHNYHDVFRSFPPGWVVGQQDGDSVSGYGWQVYILPYIEQSNLYNRLEFESPLPVTGEERKLLEMPLEVYQCPDDVNGTVNRYRDGFGRSCYSGNYGSLKPSRWLDGRAESLWPGAVPAATNRKAAPRRKYGKVVPQQGKPEPGYGALNGVFSWNSKIRIRDVTDGSSHTLMVGERSKKSQWGIWAGVGANKYETDAVTDSSFASPINKSLTGWSGSHAGGVYVLLVDGSVRFLSEKVDSRADGEGVLQSLASINGGEIVPHDATQKRAPHPW